MATESNDRGTAISFDDHIAELTSYTPTPAQPASQEPVETKLEPAVAEPIETTAKAEPEPTRPPPTAEPVGAPFTATLRNRKFTSRDDLIKALSSDDGLLRSLVASSEQFPDLQEKYQKMLEGIAAERATPAPSPEAPGQVSSEMVRSWAAPKVQELVDGGFIEKEVAEFYPNTVANNVLLKEIAYAAAAKVDALDKYVRQASQGQEIERFLSKHDGVLDQVATSHATFADLQKSDVRDDFKQFIATKVNPPAEQANDPEFLKGMFLAYKKDLFLAAPPNKTDVGASEVKKMQKRNAAGDSPRTRPAAGKPLEGQDAHFQELWEQGRQE